MAARRLRLAGWRRTASASPGRRLPMAMPPRTRRWPPTSRQASSPRAGCATTSTLAPGSSTGWWSGPSAGASARSSSGRPATTAGPSATPSGASAGSRSTIPRPSMDKQERLARLGLATRQVRYVPADFARDPVADRLTAAGLDPGQPSLFLLEGVAVYLEPAVLERVLRQFRQVAGSGSRLAISVSTASADGEARSRFRASLARLGEPGQVRPGRRPGHRAPRPYRLARHGGGRRRGGRRRGRSGGRLPPRAPPLSRPAPRHRRPRRPYHNLSHTIRPRLDRRPRLHRRPSHHRPGRRLAALLQAVPPASAPPTAH